jgi:hypothetical protein
MFTTPDQRLARFAERHDGVFSIEHARTFGLSEHQIRRRSARSWQTIHPGIYRMPGAPPTWRGDLRAAVWAAPGRAAISHWAAAAIYELPGGRLHVELTCARWSRARRAGLIVHESRRLTEADIDDVGGIPVTRPERLLLDLAALRPSPNYLEMLIHAARRKRLITYESTHEVFLRHARRGLRGVRALRAALERWDPGRRATESEMETVLLQALREQGLPEPVVQFDVHDRNGLFVARTDLGWPTLRVTLDYDSRQEHSDEFQIARDDRRRNQIVTAGYRPLVARLGDVRNSVREICEQIREMGQESA